MKRNDVVSGDSNETRVLALIMLFLISNNFSIIRRRLPDTLLAMIIISLIL